MSIPWDAVGSALAVAGGAAWLWFSKMRTAAKLKGLQEVRVCLKDGGSFTGRCVDMVKVGARNYLKFNVLEDKEDKEDEDKFRERLVPNDQILELCATRVLFVSPRMRMQVSPAYTTSIAAYKVSRALTIAAYDVSIAAYVASSALTKAAYKVSRAFQRRQTTRIAGRLPRRRGRSK